jgi:uroporphyrinogen-III synthase
VSLPRVLVVRSGANPFATLGEGAGVEVVEKVSHRIEDVSPPEHGATEPPDLVAFTSQVAVERLDDPRLSWLLEAAQGGARTAAVGSATADALKRRGIDPRWVAEGSAEALLDALPGRMEGWRVLLPCGEDAAADLPEGMRRRGARVERIVVYRKVAQARDVELEREILERPFAAFCATSPSAAGWLFEGLSEAASEQLRRTPAVVLGRFTRRFLESRGVDRIAVTAQARFSSALGLLETLATASSSA